MNNVFELGEAKMQAFWSIWYREKQIKRMYNTTQLIVLTI